MNFYSSGKSCHESIQSLLASDRSRYEKEYLVEYQGISGSIDVYDKRYNIPIEFKTPRSPDPPKKPYDYNVSQLKAYMAMLGADCGRLQYQMIANKTDEYAYMTFWLHMNRREREDKLRDLKMKFETLTNAVENNDPSLEEGVYDDPALKWLCYSCPYLDPCQKMR
jgi:CRISPR/Cas system-associated exonuclease Cas4 (RecB family)